jgi:hypothetical protein
MPNLINDNGYNGLGGLAQNYRRTRVGNSQFGTRQLQMYEIHIYGLSDAVADNDNVYEGSRDIVLDGTDDIDQPPISELKSSSIVEAILRGVQEMAEIYLVGHPDYYHYDPDNNELVITVAVSADTVESNWEQYINRDNNGSQNFNPNSLNFYSAIGNSVDDWASTHEEYWEDLDVYPAYLIGDGTDTYGPWALARLDPTQVAVKDAQKARSAAKKAVRVAAGKVSYTPKRTR